jgi:hypothetical protein
MVDLLTLEPQGQTHLPGTIFKPEEHKGDGSLDLFHGARTFLFFKPFG